jgi:hypothetical protein
MVLKCKSDLVTPHLVPRPSDTHGLVCCSFFVGSALATGLPSTLQTYHVPRWMTSLSLFMPPLSVF